MKELNHGTELTNKIVKGANLLADYVGATLGPKGTNVVIKSQNTRPFITKDGVTVAKYFELKDEFENLGVEIIKQASAQTNSEAGDGTTTSTVLARSMLNEATKYVAVGYAPIEIKRGMDKAGQKIIEHLRDNAKPISSLEDIQHIATISANNDKSVGELVAKAVDMVGKNGSITIEDSKGFNTVLEFVDGFSFDSGYLAQAFVNNERKQTVEFQNTNILVTDRKLTTVEELLPVLEIASRDNKPLLIVADDVEGQALAALIANALRGSMKVVAIKAPRYGEEKRAILADLCVATGAFFFTRESGVELNTCKLTHFGQVKRVEIGKKHTILVGGNGSQEKVEERIEMIKDDISKEDDLRLCEVMQERITRLASSIAIIKVGASSEVELIEKRHRIEDALEAVRSAQKEGIHCGGGMSLIKAYKAIDIPKDLCEGERMGFRVVHESLKAPLEQMANNAGLSSDLIFEKAVKMKNDNGINLSNGETVNMIEAGIIDPVRVTCSAIRNAVSVSSTLITTYHAIVEK
jgi:chaperonin GroEL